MLKMLKMLKIIDKRCTGKTTKLIEQAVKDNAVLVVPTFRHADFVRDLSEKMGVSTHLEIIDFYEFWTRSLPGYSASLSDKKYYIDDLDACLASINVIGYSCQSEEKNQNGSEKFNFKQVITQMRLVKKK